MLLFVFLRYLIEHGAHVGAVNSEGELPLDVATEDAMERLLKEEIKKQGGKPACLGPALKRSSSSHPTDPHLQKPRGKFSLFLCFLFFRN